MTGMNDLTMVRMVAVDGTPAEALQWDGQTVGIPSSAIPGMGSGPEDPGILMGIRGYPRAADGVTEYVMTPLLDPVTDAYIEALPVSTQVKARCKDVATSMIDSHAVSAADVRTYLGTLYNPS